MAIHSVQHVSFHLSVCIVKSTMRTYISMCLVLWNSCYNTSVTGTSHVIGSSQAVLAKVGDNVILPCHIEQPVDMARKTVEWSRPDLKPAYVYLLQDGHIASNLNPLYKQRTSLFHEELPHGNISLKLTRVQLSDEGTYKCFASHLDSSSLIQLLVGAVSPPVITSNGPKDSLSLTCDSGCWYPQPEVSWLDQKGNIITDEPLVKETSSQYCYVVQRTLTVRQAGTVTCRVHLPHINHTDETHHVMPVISKLPEEGRSARTSAGIVVTVIIIWAAIMGYLYWKKNTTEQVRVRYQQPQPPRTTPEPRIWISVSKRWRQQLEKLANIDDCKVTKVGRLVMGKEEFDIAMGREGTQIFLGLRDDGTEVAIKRMPRLAGMKKEDFSRLPKLDHPSIVRYVDFAEDENFSYLALQLCEYSLEEYITKHNLSELERKQLVNQVLQSLSVLHGQNPTILHRNIKPQNVLIDIQSKARLADFGIISMYKPGRHSSQSGEGKWAEWSAKEILDGDVSNERSSSPDIQVSGMLLYYILSGGEHPFGTSARCKTNILDGKHKLDHVQDVVAKDLIKSMINGNPNKRPKVEECLAHPYFWKNERRVEYLRRIGKEVDNCPDDDKDLITVLDQYAEQGQFNTWKHKLSLELKMDEIKSYPENSFGLLRFIHNLHEHYAEKAAGVDLMEMFPDLFGCVYQFAQEQRWNSRPTLKDMFKTQDVLYESSQTL